MKKILIIIILVHSCLFLFAQNDSITSRDTITFSYQIKKVLIPDYENLLNMISDKSFAQNEIEDIIKNKTKGAVESRIFVNDSVIIDSDLNPGADTNKLLRGEKNAVDYLHTFYTNYTRSDKKTVSLNVVQISPLKKKNYFYSNVLFECDYGSTNISGKAFSKFQRVAEVKFIYDKEWRSYISAIRFPDSTDMSPADAYKKIKITDTDVDKLFSYYEEEKEKKGIEEKNKINALITEGDIFADAEKYEEALNKYLEAQRINFADKDAKAAVNKAREAMAEEKKKKKSSEEKKAHIDEMKKNAMREKGNYNFMLAKILCDSIIQDFKVNDSDIDKLGDQMSGIISSLSGIEAAMENKNLNDAVKKCRNNFEKAASSDNISKAEFQYRWALAYSTLDSGEIKTILEHLNLAIELSGNHHQEALKLRTKIFLQTNQVSDAVVDATQIINNDSRNPANYLFIANLYEKDKKYQKAIDAYKSAIGYGTTDTTAFFNKSYLELNIEKNSDAKKTASDGIEKTACYGMLFFNRGIANDKLRDCKSAGDDFRKAGQCGIGDKQRNWITNISENYVSVGKSNFTKGALYDARNQFGNAILIDSNHNALYERARVYAVLGKNDSAITDLDNLIRKTSDYRDAHKLRGIAYSNFQNYTAASSDFKEETKRFPDNASAWYAKGQCEMIQEKWDVASVSFEQAGTQTFSDSAFYLASLAAFNNKKYDQAIALSTKARDKDTKMFKVYYVAGRANYEMHNYKGAIKEFEAAQGLVKFDDDLFFWHAAALEANEKYFSASQAFDLLNSSAKYKDTAAFRSGICLIKTREDGSCNAAIKKFNLCYITGSDVNKSEVYAWTAYAYLCMGAQKNADDFIGRSEKANTNNAMLLYVLACNNTKNKMFDEAMNSLEKAIPYLKLQGFEPDKDPLLKELRKNPAVKDRYEKLKAKSFN